MIATKHSGHLPGTLLSCALVAACGPRQDASPDPADGASELVTETAPATQEAAFEFTSEAGWVSRPYDVVEY